MNMKHDQVTELLKNYRSYEYAATNCGEGPLPLVVSERMKNPNMWDQSRYNRIVNMVKGAVEHVLSDDQRTVIMRKYLERNTLNLNEISTILNRDRTTIGRWHTEAIRRLSIALEPLTVKETEITPFEHMFEPNWTYREPRESA